eukprot:jgi/Hompol1/3118/HPOL_006349-RA
MCPDINDHRSIEVQYHCCDNEHVSFLREYSVCKYVIHVHTPLMCYDRMFQVQTHSAKNKIECMQIDSSLADSATLKLSSTQKGAYLVSVDEPSVSKKPNTLQDIFDTNTNLEQQHDGVPDTDAQNSAGSNSQPKWLTVNDMRRNGCASPINCNIVDPASVQKPAGLGVPGLPSSVQSATDRLLEALRDVLQDPEIVEKRDKPIYISLTAPLDPDAAPVLADPKVIADTSEILQSDSASTAATDADIQPSHPDTAGPSGQENTHKPSSDSATELSSKKRPTSSDHRLDSMETTEEQDWALTIALTEVRNSLGAARRALNALQSAEGRVVVLNGLEEALSHE